jgi:DNA-binding SARP family transcriptional activator
MTDSALPSLRISLLGKAAFSTDEGSSLQLKPKAAGMVAYLALQGETPRDRLASLLWPGVPQANARNNLSQTIRRLKAECGHAGLLHGKDTLCLAAGTKVDVLELLQAHRAGQADRVAALEGELLAGMSFADCAEFSTWLDLQRQHLVALRWDALAELTDIAERNGDLHAALGLARRLLDCDPCREIGHQRLIRLYWLVGDRPAALRTYEQCRVILMRELGLHPSAETLALMRSIERSMQPPAGEIVSLRRLPPHFHLPPVLVGRETELERMEEAWSRGQAIFISGMPGVGKTRLTQEFLGAKGRFYTFEGQPEDRSLPYANHARTCRQILRAFPGLVLPDWVRREMARYLPELGPSPGPLSHDEDKLRFFQAVAEMTRLAVEAGMHRVAVHDLQFMDQPSLELGHFVFAPYWGQHSGLRTVLTFRPDELAPEAAQAVNWVLDRGQGVLIELEPLSAEGMTALLESMDPGLLPWCDALQQHTGGNPGLVLETLKAMLESGLLDQPPQPHQTLPIPEKARALLRRRLNQLSREALELARLAALAGDGFNPPLACQVLQQPAHRLTQPWAELESTHVLSGNRFVHGLMRHVVQEDIPEPLRSHLLEAIQAARPAGPA